MNINLMIVAHPDDEVLWGGSLLEDGSFWDVVCITNLANTKRRSNFFKVADLYGFNGKMFEFTDDIKVSEYENNQLNDVIAQFGNDKKYNKIVTHSPHGEYGHPMHIKISRLVTNNVNEKNKLHYFHSSVATYKPLSAKRIQAYDVYFNNFSNILKWKKHDLYFSSARFLNIVKSVFAFLQKNILIFKLYSKYKMTFCSEPEQSDLHHCIISKSYDCIKYAEYKKKNTHQHQLLIKTFDDVFYNDIKLYQQYNDRKYIVTEFLPNVEGSVLNVGCHSFNQFDCYCLKDPNNYESIDIEEKWSIYGSPFKHQTCDFLEFESNYKFNAILLFGVMGIPNLVDGDSGNYSMYDFEDRVVEQVDRLLNIGGYVLFGPDYRLDKTKKLSDKIAYWKNYAYTNNTLKNKYQLIERFRTSSNIVIVCQKKL